MKVRCLAAIFVLLVVFSLCPQSVSQAKKVKIKSVTVTSQTGKTAYVAKGKKVKLTPTVKVSPNKKTYKKVKYKSSNKKIATVSTAGKVKGKKVGKTKITITSKYNSKKKAKITVHITKPLTKIRMNRKTTSVEEGQTTDLSVNFTPKSGVYKKLTWTTSDKKVATVKDGVITGVKEGVAKIRATAKDGTKRYTTCMVAVLPKPISPVVPENSMKSAEAVSSGVIRVELTSKEVLGTKDWNVMSKQYFTGKYLKSHVVERIRTADFIHYDLFLTQEIAPSRYIRVATSLDGKEVSKETVANYMLRQATPPELIVSATTGSSIKVDVDFGYYQTGNRIYSVVNLPNGLQSQMTDNKLILTGKIPMTCDNVIATAISTDELGKTVSRKIRFLISGTKSVVGYLKPITVIAGEDFEEELPLYLSFPTDAKISALKYPAGLSIKDKYIKGRLGIGTYDYAIRVGTKTVKGSIEAKQSVTLSGCAVSGAAITALSYDVPTKKTTVIAGSDGSFSLKLLPGFYDFLGEYQTQKDYFAKQQLDKDMWLNMPLNGD